MKLRDLVLLLPSYELEGYPRTLDAERSRDVLSGWLALWHPQLIAAAQTAPRWHSAAQLPGELQEIVFVLPQISVDALEPQGEERIAAAGGRLLRPSQHRWRELQTELLGAAASLGGDPSAGAPSAASPPAEAADLDRWLPEFAALGYAFLQIQLMTRQLRYTSNLDLLLFGQQLTQAAEAALAGNDSETSRLLQTCFDALGQERDHYYSLDVHLLDVTLLASSTLGKSLTTELEQAGQPGHPPTSFLTNGQLLREMQTRPGQLERLRAAVEQRLVGVVGGLDYERPHPLMSREATSRDLARGRAAYEACGFKPPRVFARSSFGLAPESVWWLRRWGFEGCLLIAWSGGSYPQGSQSKISWEAPDGTFLSAVAAPVLDAANPASYLSLGWTVGEALDHQHVPTLVFAHWPNQSCEFAELLTIVARRTPALGQWQLTEDYFSNTDQPYHQERLAASGFRYNWLLDYHGNGPASTGSSDSSGSPGCSRGDLIRATQLFFELSSRLRSLQNLANLAWQLQHFRPTEKGEQPAAEPAYHSIRMNEWSPGLAELADRIDGLLDQPRLAAGQRSELLASLAEQRAAVLSNLARRLVPAAANSSSNPAASGGALRLLLNPRSAAVRVSTHTLPNQHLPAGDQDKWHFAEGRVGEGRVTRVDIPALGFVAAPVREELRGSTPKQTPLADTGGLLHNEFLEVQIDTQRGHVRSLHVPAKRGNRLSLMIARRDQIPSDSKRPPATAAGKAVYSEMVASDVRMLTSSNICGVVRATGHLHSDGERIARFEIDYEVWRGSRIVEVNIRLSDLAPLASDNPWHSAYVLRLAWPTEAAILRTHAGGCRHAWSGAQAVSPSLIEIDEVDYRTHYLPGGLAFHRRTEERFLETILATQGDQQVAHRVGVAVDLPQPSLAAEQFVDDAYEITLPGVAVDQPSSGWLVSVDTRAVTVDLEAPLVDAEGKLVGVRLFVSELEGKSTSAKIRLLHEVEAAARVDYLGGKIGKLTTDGDRLIIALRAHEQVNVDVLWK